MLDHVHADSWTDLHEPAEAMTSPRLRSAELRAKGVRVPFCAVVNGFRRGYAVLHVA
jgi:hypothetical protein